WAPVVAGRAVRSRPREGPRALAASPARGARLGLAAGPEPAERAPAAPRWLASEERPPRDRREERPAAGRAGVERLSHRTSRSTKRACSSGSRALACPPPGQATTPT